MAAVAAAQALEEPMLQPPADGGYNELAASESKLVKEATAKDRMNFVRKVYGIVASQLLLTALIATPVAERVKTMGSASVSHLLLFSFVMTMVTLFAMVCCGSDLLKKTPHNYLLLAAFTAFEGVMVGAGCAQFSMKIVVMALFVTTFVVGGLSAFAWTTKTDFTGMGPYLVAAVLALSGVSLVMCFLCMAGVCPHAMIMVYNLIGVLSFSMYLVYDTQLIIGGNHAQQFELDDYIFAALNLYLDIINLFLYILQLLGSDRS